MSREARKWRLLMILKISMHLTVEAKRLKEEPHNTHVYAHMFIYTIHTIA
jgi:hypothetical protein